MAFTEFLFEPETISQQVEEKRAALLENRGLSDFPGFALGVIKRRLEKDPLRYRDYGPYWWALKDLLRDSEYDLGDDDDKEVREVYTGEEPAETIVMADAFRTEYLGTYFVGTNQLVLDGESGETYTLFDDDMENSPSALERL